FSTMPDVMKERCRSAEVCRSPQTRRRLAVQRKSVSLRLVATGHCPTVRSGSKYSDRTLDGKKSYRENDKTQIEERVPPHTSLLPKLPADFTLLLYNSVVVSDSTLNKIRGHLNGRVWYLTIVEGQTVSPSAS